MPVKRVVKPYEWLGEKIASCHDLGNELVLRTVVGSYLAVRDGLWELQGFGRYNYLVKFLTAYNRVVVYRSRIIIRIKFVEGGRLFDLPLGYVEAWTPELEAWFETVQLFNVQASKKSRSQA